MADLPPPYSLTNDYIKHPAVPSQTLTYVDFFPQCTLSSLYPEFNKFSSVVETANHWLVENPGFRPTSCETVSTSVNKEDHTIVLKVGSLTRIPTNGDLAYLKGLRVWVTPCSPAEDGYGPSVIGYINVIPQAKNKDDFLKNGLMSYMVGGKALAAASVLHTPAFEGISETVSKLNERLTSSPLPGKILTVESIDMNFCETFKGSVLDPEVCYWVDSNKAHLSLKALRVFYIAGEPACETIVVKDILPKLLKKAGPMGRIPFDSFTGTMSSASNWIAQQHNCRAVGIQSLAARVLRCSSEFSVDTDRSELMTMFSTNGSDNTKFLKFIRVALVKHASEKHAGGPIDPRPVTCLNAFPDWCKQTGDFEDDAVTLQKANAWLGRAGVHVLNVESVTSEVLVGQKMTDTEETFVNKPNGRKRQWLSGIRLYVLGDISVPEQILHSGKNELSSTSNSRKSKGCILM